MSDTLGVHESGCPTLWGSRVSDTLGPPGVRHRGLQLSAGRRRGFLNSP